VVRFILRRLGEGAISILGASLIVFVTSRLSGDPVTLMLPPDAPQSAFIAMQQTLGLDRPVAVQYGMFLEHALRGDFGQSYRWQMPASQLIVDRLPATIQLAVAGLVFSLIVAIPVGVLSAVHRGTWIDRLGRVFAMLGQAMPAFWVGLLLILAFAIQLDWLPAFGYGGLNHLVLPATALGWYPVAAMTRIVRSAMLDVLQADHIRLSRALGTPEALIVWKYAFRNAAVPLLTMLGVYFAAMLGGSFVVEVIFAWPGVGRTVVEAVFSRDFPVVQAGVLSASVMFVLANLLVDLSYGFVDPRIRHER
jgi:peptide/nickel transport system permease protein